MPGDLNLKKSWHTGLVKNQQKVWQKEQDALAEHQKIKERQKEIEAEREREELIKLQYGSDLLSLPASKKLELNNLSWMYEGGGSARNSQKNESGFTEVTEEFTEGKQQIEDMLSGKQAVGKTSVRDDLSNRIGKVLNCEKPDKVIDYGVDDPLMKIQGKVKRIGGSGDSSDRSSLPRQSDSNGLAGLSGHRRSSERSSSNRTPSERRSSDRSSSNRSSLERSSLQRSSSDRSSTERSSLHRSSLERSSSHRSSSNRSSSDRNSSDRSSSHRSSSGRSSSNIGSSHRSSSDRSSSDRSLSHRNLSHSSSFRDRSPQRQPTVTTLKLNATVAKD